MEIETGPIPEFTLRVSRKEMMIIEIGLSRLNSKDDKLVWGEDTVNTPNPMSSYRLWRQVREVLGYQ